ncbi:sulfurtransferase TusA family protein [Sneathiella glossodoripedis]|uniref:sulfurtransferase TusA family protein n=1 Tax=Sneathiella glossodoripedis TaxID=418853 RepID=UPI00046F806E|nr:sulfurtransferase TusA family protein [Sneathiella glossodoripedis]
MSDHRLDTSGLSCPLPVLKTKKLAASLSPGDKLTVIATDPASSIDFDHYCHVAGHKLLSSSEKDGTFTYIIEIGG